MTNSSETFGVPAGATCSPRNEPAVLRFAQNDDGTIEIGKASRVHHDRNFLLVGRQAATCDIRISQKSMSRQHALLYYHQGKLYVKDLQTKTGTFVNQQRILPGEPTMLNSGDTIQWGKVQPVFTVEWKGDEESTRDDASSTAKDVEANNLQSTPNTTMASPPTEPELTGRAKRQAEIAAMMASLEETPSYTKYIAPTTTSKEESNISVQEKKQKAPIIEKYKLPLTESTPLTSFDSSIVSSLVMDPSGARFAIGSMDSSLKLYDFAGLSPLDPTPFSNAYVQEGYPIRSMAYSPTGDRLIVATGSAQPRMLDREGQELLQWVRGDVYVTDPAKTIGHTAAVTSVGWHPLERSTAFTCSRDGSWRVWNVDKGKLSFGMLTCKDVVMIKNQKTGRKTIPTCLHVTPSHVYMGTVCGNLQAYKYPLVSKLRPQQSTVVSKSNEGIVCIAGSMDATKIAVRTATNIYVYNSRFSTSSVPLLNCSDVGRVDDTENSTPTMAFNPNGKLLCAGVYQNGSSSIQIYAIPKEVAPSPTTVPVFSLPLHTPHPIVGLSWHFKLNQIVLVTTKQLQLWYSSDYSKKGVLLASGRRRKRKGGEDDLQEFYASRAPPPGSAIRLDQIVTPNALPLFGGRTTKRGKAAKVDDDEAKLQMPEKPSKGIYATSNTMFTQMVMDTQTKTQKQIAGKDPREALAEYSEGKSYIGTAYEGNKERILAEQTVEEEEDAMKQKKKT